MTYYTLANVDIINVPSQKRVIRFNNIKKKQQFIFFALIGLLITLSTLYIFAINSIVRNTYELRALNKKSQELKNRNQLLEIELVNQRSASNIQRLIVPLNLVAIDKIEYIVDKNNSFALANRQ